MIFILLVNSFFSYYFFFLGFWWIALIPLLFNVVLFFGFHDITSSSKKFFLKNVQNQFLSYIWILLNIGLAGLMYTLMPYFGYSEPVSIFLLLMLLNIFLFFYSFVIEYEDGKTIFQYGYYFCWACIGVYYVTQIGNFEILKTFVACSAGVYAFLRSIIGLLKPIDRTYEYILAWRILILLISVFSSNPLVLGMMGQIIILLFLVIAYEYHFKAKKIENSEISEIATYKDMILNHKPYKSYITLDKNNNIIFLVQKFFSDLPSWFKLGLALLSSGFLFLSVLFFVQNIGFMGFGWFQLFLWTSVGLYGYNFFLSKKLHFTHSVQRYILFIIINLGVYITIINLPGNGDSFGIVLLGMLWALGSNGAIQLLKSDSNQLGKSLSKKDYQVWLLANVFLSLINIYFMVHYSFSSEITLFLVIIFVAMQAFITYYNLASIKK